MFNIYLNSVACFKKQTDVDYDGNDKVITCPRSAAKLTNLLDRFLFSLSFDERKVSAMLFLAALIRTIMSRVMSYQ